MDWLVSRPLTVRSSGGCWSGKPGKGRTTCPSVHMPICPYSRPHARLGAYLDTDRLGNLISGLKSKSVSIQTSPPMLTLRWARMSTHMSTTHMLTYIPTQMSTHMLTYISTYIWIQMSATHVWMWGHTIGRTGRHTRRHTCQYEC